MQIIFDNTTRESNGGAKQPIRHITLILAFLMTRSTPVSAEDEELFKGTFYCSSCSLRKFQTLPWPRWHTTLLRDVTWKGACVIRAFCLHIYMNYSFKLFPFRCCVARCPYSSHTETSLRLRCTYFGTNVDNEPISKLQNFKHKF